jgi:hypothetical protein
MRVCAPERLFANAHARIFPLPSLSRTQERGDGSETFSERESKCGSQPVFGFTGAQMKDCIFNQSVQTKQRLANETDLIIYVLFQRRIPQLFALGKSLVLNN